MRVCGCRLRALRRALASAKAAPAEVQAAAGDEAARWVTEAETAARLAAEKAAKEAAEKAAKEAAEKERNRRLAAEEQDLGQTLEDRAAGDGLCEQNEDPASTVVKPWKRPTAQRSSRNAQKVGAEGEDKWFGRRRRPSAVDISFDL